MKMRTKIKQQGFTLLEIMIVVSIIVVLLGLAISWGSDYVYRSPGLKNPGTYDLYSAGPDRIPDTPDDDWGQ